MKTIACLLMAVCLIVCGCATDGSESKPSQDNTKNPEVGMTKEQVIELYGTTDNQQVSSEGETWIYNLNMGEAFIPFNFGYRPKMRIITFGDDGKVKSWSYTK